MPITYIYPPLYFKSSLDCLQYLIKCKCHVHRSYTIFWMYGFFFSEYFLSVLVESMDAKGWRGYVNLDHFRNNNYKITTTTVSGVLLSARHVLKILNVLNQLILTTTPWGRHYYPLSQMRKLDHRKVNSFTQGYTTIVLQPGFKNLCTWS